MNRECEDFVRAMADGDATAAASPHPRQCPACALLLRVPDGLSFDAPRSLSPGLALREALHEARPVRAVSTARRSAPTVVVALASVATSMLLGRAGSTGMALGFGLSAFGASGMALVFWRGPDGVGSPAVLRRAYPAAAAAAAVLAALLHRPELPVFRASLGRLPSPGTAVDAVGRAPSIAADDLAATVAAAGLMLVLSATAALLGARRTTPNLPALTGATLGAAAALLGLGVAHHGVAMPPWSPLLVVVLSSAACAGMGRRMLSP